MPLLIPALTVLDNQDGTATITVSGGDPDATNAIRYSRLEEPGWVDITTIAGNNSATVPVICGLRWYAAFASLGGESSVSAPEPLVVTLAPQAVFEQCLVAVTSLIQGAAAANKLGEITPERVVRQDAVDSEHLGVPLPAIVITPGLSEAEEGGTDKSDDLSYPILVGIVDRKDSQESANTPLYLYWREAIRHLFINRRLPGVRTSWKNVVHFEAVLDHKEDEEDLNWFSTALRIECKTRELRWQ